MIINQPTNKQTHTGKMLSQWQRLLYCLTSSQCVFILSEEHGQQQKIISVSCLCPKIVSVMAYKSLTVKTQPWHLPSYLLFNLCPLLIRSSLHLSASHFPNHPFPLLTLLVFPPMLSPCVFLNPSSLLLALPPCPSQPSKNIWRNPLHLFVCLAVVLICQIS